jgi:acyl-CoA synthetase (AMP-forming)/AMP-acid ligase II
VALGGMGYPDAAGYLYLTDRAAHMIISSGVNIYPQEIENVVIFRPRWPMLGSSVCPMKRWARRSSGCATS